ncbi:helix-turn-helix transcriptional regulator [Paractinoplanes ferrugineus]|uniref:AraC family transcriptional regulator n=1 Tax=Paractinoplanes ferrugineus TaxID=113564 RepID=A0A919IUY9_9ACTN|nr:helix-turn-helix domain-containing protein [Actinoplanes ferrugineus]GIE09445.1 AraC family transcriptional regulator [Actinoplanes ferrugineus]
MLDHSLLVRTPFGRVAAVRCPGDHPAWSPEEPVTSASVVLVRRGVFLRSVDGRTSVADVTTGYLQRPGECQRVAHPAGADVCTALTVPDDLADRLAHAGAAVHVSAAADLAHRHLLADPTPDRVAELIDALLPASPALSWPRAAAIDEVRVRLHADPSSDLPTLAAAVGWSPWHLSRMFRRTTGCTLRAYRRHLRVRAALDELPDAPDLADLAVRTGFADQSHMTRAVRQETGRTPAALARSLHPPAK